MQRNLAVQVQGLMDMADVDQSSFELTRFEEAFERVLPEIEAFPESELAAMNVDVPQAVTSVLGSWKEIASLRERVVSELPKLDMSMFDKVEAYALATGHAHTLYMAASSPTGMQALADEAAQLREVLYSDAVALSKRGLIDGQRLKELKGPQGYRNLAFDLFALKAMMREKWSELQSKTAIQVKELERAGKLADQLVQAVGDREQGPGLVIEATDRRRKAFSLLAKAYDQARRAVTFLRWEQGDVDDIAPSLYAGRGGSKRRATETTNVPTPAPSAQPNGQQPAAPSATPAGQPQASFGMPDGSPFTRS